MRPGDAKAWFELAGAYDFQGQENDALPRYNKVMELGVESLPLDDQPRIYIQLGSTLRNLKLYTQSKEILRQGAQHFPTVTAIKAFLALTEYSSGNHQESSRQLFQALLSQAGNDSDDKSISDYRRALSNYIATLDSFP